VRAFYVSFGTFVNRIRGHGYSLLISAPRRISVLEPSVFILNQGHVRCAKCASIESTVQLDSAERIHGATIAVVAVSANP
jgi:hypothetical protein